MPEQVFEGFCFAVELEECPTARLGQVEDIGANVATAFGGKTELGRVARRVLFLYGLHARQRRERVAGAGAAQLDHHVRAPPSPLNSTSTAPSAAMRPRLMITTREHVCWTSGSTCVERITVRSRPNSLIRRRI